MHAARDHLVEAIQACGRKAVIVVTGGGSGAVHALLSHPGASRFVLDVRIPYSPDALKDFLGCAPASACSEEAAIELARAAFDCAARITDRPLGIACTAALQTSRHRRGADRAYICIQSAEKRAVHKLELEAAPRNEQEEAVSAALLDYMAEFLGVAS